MALKNRSIQELVDKLSNGNQPKRNRQLDLFAEREGILVSTVTRLEAENDRLRQQIKAAKKAPSKKAPSKKAPSKKAPSKKAPSKKAAKKAPSSKAPSSKAPSSPRADRTTIDLSSAPASTLFVMSSRKVPLSPESRVQVQTFYAFTPQGISARTVEYSAARPGYPPMATWAVNRSTGRSHPWGPVRPYDEGETPESRRDWHARNHGWTVVGRQKLAQRSAAARRSGPRPAKWSPWRPDHEGGTFRQLREDGGKGALLAELRVNREGPARFEVSAWTEGATRMHRSGTADSLYLGKQLADLYARDLQPSDLP